MTFPADPRPYSDPAYDPLVDLLNLLDLVPADYVDPGAAGAAGHPVINSLGERDAVYYGRSQPMLHGRVFGGQVVAQSVVAAGRSVVDVPGPERHLHSLHGYFLRPGDANEPIQFAVQRLYDGGSFSTRRVHAIQYGKAILSMIFSFQIEASGVDHQVEMPQVPPPETLPPLSEVLAPASDEPRLVHGKNRPIDLRHVEGPIYERSQERSSTQHVWLRATGELPDDPLLHTAILAYASDYTVLEPTLRRHGITWSDERLRAASLDHSMWFHRTARVDEWILYSETSPSAIGGRGLNFGHMFTRDGALIASVAQEGMVRVKQA